jgi:hypothetical protein
MWFRSNLESERSRADFRPDSVTRFLLRPILSVRDAQLRRLTAAGVRRRAQREGTLAPSSADECSPPVVAESLLTVSEKRTVSTLSQPLLWVAGLSISLVNCSAEQDGRVPTGWDAVNSQAEEKGGAMGATMMMLTPGAKNRR